MSSPRLFALAACAAAFVAGAAACTAPSESDDAVAGSDSAFSEEQVANDPTLKALRERATSDLEQYEISVAGIDVPEPNASVGTTINGFGTSGLDWFKNPDVGYPDNKRWEQGTDTGKKCQWAAIFRFHAIFENPPAEAIAMKELVTPEGARGMWSGRFWSWIDDYASTNSTGEPTPAYAWSSGLWKWIGASGKGDTCKIPTRAMVRGMMIACKEHALRNGGDPKGCRMPRLSEVQHLVEASDAGAGDAGDASADAARDASGDGG